MRTLVCLVLSSVTLHAQVTPKVDPAKPFDIMDWTPRPAVGKGEPYEKMQDPQWDDARFRSMDTGPAFNATFRYVNGRQNVTVYKGAAVKVGDASILFDRATMRMAAGWSGGYLQHSARRFALLNTPTPANGSTYIFSTLSSLGWADAQGKMDYTAQPTIPVGHIEYKGHYLHGDRVVFSYRVNGVDVLDTVKRQSEGLKSALLRSVRVGPTKSKQIFRINDSQLSPLPESDTAVTYFSRYGDDIKPEVDDLDALTKPGPKRWGDPIVTKLVKGDESGPFAIDTLTIPYENKHKALFYCTGLDFLADGRIALCTCHGDVWLVTVNEKEGTCSWQRYATGLYHPLGLKVVDGKVVVLERGQLTRLHDNNDDGEADYYECISNRWHTGTGEHSYDTCLETDSDGNYYFFKTGDPHLPHGGCLLTVPKSGGDAKVYSTGFRHPIGMGMGPKNILTGADQEGNWMPATRIDEYKNGGFYGDMRAAHRDPLPKTYDGPLTWLPREVDNSAGGQVWVPEKTFGALAGHPIHFSFGRCRAFVLLRQELSGGSVQGGVAPLSMNFLSGSCRGRFHKDMLYVCGLNGWQTAAKADGSLQRVRATGKPLNTVIQHEVTKTGVKLTFTDDLDSKTAENVTNYKAAEWNYRWVGDYGSKRWKISNPNIEGQDERKIAAIKVIDKRTLLVELTGGVHPVMQLQLGYNLMSAAGEIVTGSVYLTVHKAE